MHCTDLQFRIFGRGIRIRCEDPHFSRLVLANYGAFRELLDVADLEYDVERRAAGGFRITRGGETLHDEPDDDAVDYRFVYTLEKLITIDLEYLRSDLYFVHASALERGGRAIMIVAASGTGKSTTAWGLLGHGFRYLSDELAPVDPAALEVHPYPHALCLKSEPPGPYPLPSDTVRTDRTLHIPVASLPSAALKGPVPLHALVFLNREKGAAVPDFADISPAEAGARLYANTLNALAHPGHGLDVAIRIAASVPAVRLNAGELRATCKLITQLADEL